MGLFDLWIGYDHTVLPLKKLWHQKEQLLTKVEYRRIKRDLSLLFFYETRGKGWKHSICLPRAICRSPMAEFVMKSMTSATKSRVGQRHLGNMATGFIRGRRGFFCSIRSRMTKTKHRFIERTLVWLHYRYGCFNVSDLCHMCPQELQYKIYSLWQKVFQDPWYTEILRETYATQVDAKAG